MPFVSPTKTRHKTRQPLASPSQSHSPPQNSPRSEDDVPGQWPSAPKTYPLATQDSSADDTPPSADLHSYLPVPPRSDGHYRTNTDPNTTYDAPAPPDSPDSSQF